MKGGRGRPSTDRQAPTSPSFSARRSCAPRLGRVKISTRSASMGPRRSSSRIPTFPITLESMPEAPCSSGPSVWFAGTSRNPNLHASATGGDAMTGAQTLPASDPTDRNHTARPAYVDQMAPPGAVIAFGGGLRRAAASLGDSPLAQPVAACAAGGDDPGADGGRGADGHEEGQGDHHPSVGDAVAAEGDVAVPVGRRGRDAPVARAVAAWLPRPEPRFGLGGSAALG